MKKVFILSVLLIALAGGVVAPGDVNTSAWDTTCVDSDGGKDYFTKGNSITTDNTYNNTIFICEETCTIEVDGSGMVQGYESCSGDNCYVRECYCSGGIDQYKDYKCSGRCEDGACIEDSNTSTCIEKNGKCCLGDICESTSVSCVDGTSAKFNGCDSNCISNWTCESTGSNTSTEPVCGNGICERGEEFNCPCADNNCMAECSEGSCPRDCPKKKPVCGNGVCEEGEGEYCPPCVNTPPYCNLECRQGTCPKDCDKDKVCCHKYRTETDSEKTKSTYHWMKESDCTTDDDGGGREVVDNKFCRKAVAVTQIRKVKNKLHAAKASGECPEECTCTGSSMKCMLASGREITIHSGESGKTIVKVEGVDMSTKVTLYKAEDGKVYGVFKGNKTKVVKYMPDEVKEKIRKRIKAKLESEEIELDEAGEYIAKLRKKARLFWVVPVKEKVTMHIDPETGEITKTKTSWWGWMARDVKEA